MSGALLHHGTSFDVVHSSTQRNFTFTRTSGLQSLALAAYLGWGTLPLLRVDTKGRN